MSECLPEIKNDVIKIINNFYKIERDLYKQVEKIRSERSRLMTEFNIGENDLK